VTEPPLPARRPRVPYTHRYWGPVWGLRVTPDGRELVLLPISRGITQLSITSRREGWYDDSWQYDRLDWAWDALVSWDGKGEPERWFRHPATGRRRPGGDPAAEFVRW
jgi:hypothetical protein